MPGQLQSIPQPSMNCKVAKSLCGWICPLLAHLLLTTTMDPPREKQHHTICGGIYDLVSVVCRDLCELSGPPIKGLDDRNPCCAYFDSDNHIVGLGQAPCSTLLATCTHFESLVISNRAKRMAVLSFPPPLQNCKSGRICPNCPSFRSFAKVTRVKPGTCSTACRSKIHNPNETTCFGQSRMTPKRPCARKDSAPWLGLGSLANRCHFLKVKKPEKSQMAKRAQHQAKNQKGESSLVKVSCPSDKTLH